ncbi:MAG: ExbD/TolR family protein [Sphingomicrobium sp.]
MNRASRAEPFHPLGEINTTPLIDVLLVLLVMLIITIPLQTHAVKFDLPGPSARPLPLPNPISNLLVIRADGTLRWNGLTIDSRELRQELAMSRQMNPSPELHLEPDADARHGDVDQLLATIKQEQIHKFGFVGNERYRGIF